MELLKAQYELLLGSRNVMLDFIVRELPDRLTEPVAAFNDNNMLYLLVHTANTYRHWLGNFGMRKGLTFANEKEIADINAIKTLYAETDKVVYDFLTQFDGQWYQPVYNKLRSGKEVGLTPLQLFTHTITHDFHHKGQLMTMCRLLGHTPPDTDIIRT